MKKTYIIPQVELHTRSVEGLIAASPDDVTINRGGSVNANEVETKSSNIGKYDVWDEDWSK